MLLSLYISKQIEYSQLPVEILVSQWLKKYNQHEISSSNKRHMQFVLVSRWPLRGNSKCPWHCGIVDEQSEICIIINVTLFACFV